MALSVQDFRLDHLKQFSSFGADLNMLSTSYYARGVPASFLRVDSVGSGSLTLQFTDGTSETLTVAQGDEYVVKFNKILATTTNVTRVTVGWIG